MLELIMKKRIFILSLVAILVFSALILFDGISAFSDEIKEFHGEVKPVAPGVPTPLKDFSKALNVSERLDYKISYGMFKVGRSSIEVLENPDGTVSLITRAYSEGWVDKVYPVNDYAESIVESFETLKPIKYIIKTREGKGRKHREYIFDHEAKQVRHIDHIKMTDVIFNTPALIFDPLSAFYYTRRIPLEVGKSVIVPMFDSRKVWPLEVKVLGRKRVDSGAGEFDTVAITPKMSSDGIFSSDGDMTIWLTDDDRRIPVLVKSKVLIGSVKVKLQGIR